MPRAPKKPSTAETLHTQLGYIASTSTGDPPTYPRRSRSPPRPPATNRGVAVTSNAPPQRSATVGTLQEGPTRATLLANAIPPVQIGTHYQTGESFAHECTWSCRGCGTYLMNGLQDLQCHGCGMARPSHLEAYDQEIIFNQHGRANRVKPAPKTSEQVLRQPTGAPRPSSRTPPPQRKQSTAASMERQKRCDEKFQAYTKQIQPYVAKYVTPHISTISTRISVRLRREFYAVSREPPRFNKDILLEGEPATAAASAHVLIIDSDRKAFNGRGRRALVVQNTKQQWMLPGGRCDDQRKSSRYTALKETKEELGLDIAKELNTAGNTAASPPERVLFWMRVKERTALADIFLLEMDFSHWTNERLSEMFRSRTTPQETKDFGWINMDRLTEMWDDIGTGELTRGGQEKKMSVTSQCIVEDFNGNIKKIGAFFRHRTLPIVQFYYYNKWHAENILCALPDVSLTDTR